MRAASRRVLDRWRSLSSTFRLRTLVAVAAATFALPVVAIALPDPAAPTGCVEPTRALVLEAREMPAAPDGGIRIGYGREGEAPSIPGPMIEMVEGECLAVTLVNRVSEETLQLLTEDPRWAGHATAARGLSLHVHGVKYTPTSDGTTHTGSFVPSGGARTYLWYASPRTSVGARVTSLGTAGYWWYHDHAGGTDHGTGGVSSGLFGALIVRRAGDIRPDVSYTVAMGGPRPQINFASGAAAFTCDSNGNVPSHSCFVAREGQRVEFVVIGLPGTVAKDDFHTFHVHGHNWADNRTGFIQGVADETRLIDAKLIGPSESFGFQVIAGESVGAGDWMLHCHVQQHSDDGMTTFFRVLDSNGLPASGSAGSTGHQVHQGHGP